MLKTFNYPEIVTIMTQLNEAKLIDYNKFHHADDLPHGHPCIHPETFFKWLIPIIELCSQICEQIKPQFNYATNRTMIDDCFRLSHTMKDCIRIYDYLDDGIEEKFNELEAYDHDLNEPNEYIEDIQQQVEHFKKIYFCTYGDHSEPEKFDFNDINDKLGDSVPYEAINKTCVDIIDNLCQYLNDYFAR